MSVPSDDELQLLRGRVAVKPSDLRFRFELGEALCRRKDYSSALPELQKAMGHTQFRRRAGELLAEAFDAKGMPEAASKMRRLISGDDPDSDGSAPVPGPASPRPPRGPDTAAAKETHRDDENA